MKRKSTIFALLLCCLLLLLLLFPLWAGRSSLAALSLPAVAAEDIRLLEVSARWEEEEYSIEDRAFFAELLSLFQGIELRPLLLPPSSYPIEKGSAYWFRVQLEDERQSVFKIMGGKLLLNVVCGESPGRQHYAITDGEEKLPEIFALLEEYRREAESSSPLLQEKLTVGLRSADVVERYAWERVQQQLSYLEKIKPELNLLDAGIQLEKTDSFEHIASISKAPS
ncbi:MAG: hypothetical protein Q4B50_03800 [Bacillota bacterium]|nr:hypothetical protein [Bacillota bacterium]